MAHGRATEDRILLARYTYLGAGNLAKVIRVSGRLRKLPGRTSIKSNRFTELAGNEFFVILG